MPTIRERNGPSDVPGGIITRRPALPLEVIEHIIDCLRGDRRTLRACTLLCRDLELKAYRTLYSAIRPSVNKMPQLMHALTHSRVSSYFTRTEEVSLYALNDVAAHHSMRMLMTLGGCCPNIKELDICYLNFRDCVPLQFNAMLTGLSQFTSLVSLKIEMACFQTLKQLHRFLYSLASLVKLDISARGGELFTTGLGTDIHGRKGRIYLDLLQTHIYCTNSAKPRPHDFW